MFPPWLRHGVLPTKSTLHHGSNDQIPELSPSKNRVALSFNYGWDWQYSIDNSLLNFDQCLTEHLVNKSEIGFYAHGFEPKELIDGNFTHGMTQEQVKMEYYKYLDMENHEMST